MKVPSFNRVDPRTIRDWIEKMKFSQVVLLETVLIFFKQILN